MVSCPFIRLGQRDGSSIRSWTHNENREGGLAKGVLYTATANKPREVNSLRSGPRGGQFPRLANELIQDLGSCRIESLCWKEIEGEGQMGRA